MTKRYLLLSFVFMLTAMAAMGQSVIIKSTAAPLIGQSATFTPEFAGTASNLWTYDWDFGDNTTHATTLSANHTYTACGNYKVKLTCSRIGNPSFQINTFVYAAVATNLNPASWQEGSLHDVYAASSSELAIDVQSTQVYYRTINNSIHSVWYNSGTQQWDWSGLNNINNAGGNLSASPDGKVFFRTTNYALNYITWTPSGWITSNLNNAAPAGTVDGPVVATNNQVFFRTSTGGINSVVQNPSTGVWSLSNLNNAATWNVAGAIAVDKTNGQIYYTSRDGRILSAYLSGGVYNWSDLNNVTYDDNLINKADSSVTVNAYGVFYKTVGGNIFRIYWTPGGWVRDPMHSVATDCIGSLISDNNNRVFYKTSNGNIRCLSFNGSTWQAVNITNTGKVKYTSNIVAANQGSVFFLTNNTNNDLIHRAYFQSPCNATASPDFQRQANNDEALSDFTVYPNPSSSIVTISSAEEIVSWKIYNLQGEQVLSSEAANDIYEVNASALSNGTYLLHATLTNGNSRSQKIQIAH